jgi:hypothetical protein
VDNQGEAQQEQPQQDQAGTEDSQESSNVVTRIVDGQRYNLSTDQAGMLLDDAIRGVIKKNQPNNKPEPTQEVQDDLVESDDETATLKNRVKQLEEERANEKELNRINTELATNRAKYDITKNNEDVAQLADLLTYANINLNPQADIGMTYSEVVGMFEKILKSQEEALINKNTNNKLITNRLRPVQRGGGSTPAVEQDKPLDRFALQNGAAKRGFHDTLQRIREEKGEL